MARGKLSCPRLPGGQNQRCQHLAEILGDQPQGRIGVVDFKLDGTGPGPSPEERVSPDVVVKDAAKAGLRLVSQEPFLQYQYLLIFGK